MSRQISQFLCISLFLTLLGGSLGCSHLRESIETGDHPLAKVKHAVKKSMPIGVRLVSENGREYFSEYYINRRGRTFKAEKMAIRKHVHVLILGDGRPYKVEVDVIKEKKLSSKSQVKPEFQFMSYDSETAKIILKRIYKILNKSREDGNIVDDFRVF